VMKLIFRAAGRVPVEGDTPRLLFGAGCPNTSGGGHSAGGTANERTLPGRIVCGRRPTRIVGN